MSLNYYQVLGVDPSSEPEVIEAAFRALMRKYHPDRAHDSDAQLRAREINEAYRVLGHAERRREYDRRRTALAEPIESSTESRERAHGNEPPAQANFGRDSDPHSKEYHYSDRTVVYHHAPPPPAPPRRSYGWVIGLVLGAALLGALLMSGTVSVTNETTTISNPQAAVTDESIDTVRLIREGSAQACSTPDARETVLRILRPQIRPDQFVAASDIEAGLASFSLNLDLITLSSVDRSVSSVSCDANLVVHQNGSPVLTTGIRYVLRPNVEDAQAFVVSAFAPEAATRLRELAAAAIFSARMARLQAEAAADAQSLNEMQSGDELSDEESIEMDPAPPRSQDTNRQMAVNGM